MDSRKNNEHGSKAVGAGGTLSMKTKNIIDSETDKTCYESLSLKTLNSEHFSLIKRKSILMKRLEKRVYKYF
jgi:hypothetical protein